MIFVKPMSYAFFTIYSFCGITDILDGYIARKMNCTTFKGAVFDSIADFLFFVTMLVIFLPIIKREKWAIIWIVIIIFVRFSSILIGFIKYHKISFLHTILNKITGFALFLFPFIYITFNFKISVFVLCVLASISAVEELIIIIKSKILNLNIKSIFEIIKQ
ncbi:MAG: CDP-alcohol phosphatidyltransferase family protein [Clostridia bacterium]|nr:CDP-alcohol phosphatidyltransferase family protein [Clostridia bacterium]MCI2013811.1 CDP-alcohol phosphatidyltransferase family protein [Clostridia bacterium]